MTNALVLFSSPMGHPRLRLDLEAKALTKVVERDGLPPELLELKHAATRTDLISSLSGADTRYRMIQISGHGDGDFLVFDDERSGQADLVDAGTVADLLRAYQPTLPVVVFLSCFSSNRMKDLQHAASYVVVVDGVADDNLAIEFSRTFFRSYMSTGDPETAFSRAQAAVSFMEDLSQVGLRTRIGRRGETIPEDSLVRATVRMGGNRPGNFTALVDVGEVAGDLAVIGLDHDDFSEILARKIDLHYNLFDVGRDNVYLPVGPNIVQFSWSNALDILRCQRVFAIRRSASQLQINMLMRAIQDYNSWAADLYRHPDGPIDDKTVGTGLQSATYALDLMELVERESFFPDLAEQQSLTMAVLAASLEVGTRALRDGDLGRAVYQLETGLSSFHDFVDRLVVAVCWSSVTDESS